MQIKKHSIVYILILVFLTFSVEIVAQHNGDNLGIQGIVSPGFPDVTAMGMGGSVNSLSGNLFSVYYNPAGLADIKKMQVSVQANYFTKLWRESQTFRPNRNQVVLPFYLEGLITPDTSKSGVLDILFYKDSTYVVKDVELGLDPYSKEAADWEKERNKTGFDNIALGVPFSLLDYKFGIAVAYNQYAIMDYDRNNTYLTPHVGSFDYGKLVFANGFDTGIVNWSRFYRDRFGTMNKVNFGLGAEISELIKLGFGVKYLFGKSDDYQLLSRFGNITFVDANKTRFTYVLNDKLSKGTSEYKALMLNAGIILSLNDVMNIAAKVDLPYTLKRDWSYNFNSVSKEILPNKMDTTIVSDINESGTDEVNVPAVITLGASISPLSSFTFSLEYEYAPYSKTTYSMAKKDTMFRPLVDRTVFRFGAIYNASKLLTFYAGYTNLPETFIPDGAADKQRGPSAETYSLGFSVKSKFGIFDVAYQWQRLKYYDQYFSNVNYALEIKNSISFGYRYEL